MSGALSWEEGNALRAANLGRSGAILIGRSPSSDILISDSSVSRDHAVIEFRGDRYVVVNRSRTNPTLLNGSPAAIDAPLADGDVLVMGNVHFQFHDLSIGDGISGPRCSHCGRENSATDKDCWFCGTSLVYAASTLRSRRLVAGRVITGGGRLDLYDGQAAMLNGGVPAVQQAQTGADEGVHVSAAGGRMLLAGGQAMVNGEPAEAGRELATGDVIEAAGGRYVVILR